MADAATDILGVSSLKQELRIRATVSSHDALLESQIKSAVSFVSRQISAPLVDQTFTLYVDSPGDDNPIVFRSRAYKAIEGIRYWTRAAQERDASDGSIAPADLGRIVQRHGASQAASGLDEHIWIYPPASGWPELLENTVMEIDVKRGLDIDVATEALRQAVILCVRQFYDGYREIRPTEAFFALIAPWRYYGI